MKRSILIDKEKDNVKTDVALPLKKVKKLIEKVSGYKITVSKPKVKSPGKPKSKFSKVSLRPQDFPFLRRTSSNFPVKIWKSCPL